MREPEFCKVRFHSRTTGWSPAGTVEIYRFVSWVESLCEHYTTHLVFPEGTAPGRAEMKEQARQIVTIGALEKPAKSTL